MLTTGNIIQNSLMRLGELGTYNDNGSAIYKRASDLLIKTLDSVAMDTSFLFNATTVNLTDTGHTSVLGENRFNKPVDMLNYLRTSPHKGVRIEGEFFYTKSSELILQYCRKIKIAEYPPYMEEYLISSLCVEMARSHNTYVDRLGYFEQLKAKEKANVCAIEGFEPIIFMDESEGSDYRYGGN